jgi:hypothetical protein
MVMGSILLFLGVNGGVVHDRGFEPLIFRGSMVVITIRKISKANKTPPHTRQFMQGLQIKRRLLLTNLIPTYL